MPEFAFLFVWFAQHPKAIALTKKKVESRGIEYCNRIFKDIADIKKDALLALHNQ